MKMKMIWQSASWWWLRIWRVPRVWASWISIFAISMGCYACATDRHEPKSLNGTSSVAVMEVHDGYKGRWLRSDRVEVFVAVEPMFRLLSFRTIGHMSLMATSDNPPAGLRLALMEPQQIPDSFDPGNQPGRLVSFDTRSANIALQASSKTDTRYTIDVALDDDKPRLAITCRLHNDASMTRTMAVWSLVSFPRRGQLVAPFGNEPRARRQLVYPFWSRLPQPGVRYGFDALTIDLDIPLQGRAFKVGLTTDAGWAAYVGGASGDTSTLLMHAPRMEQAIYPEGNANVTLFEQDTAEESSAQTQSSGAMTSKPKTWAEIEMVGPLMRVEPGQSIQHHQSLWLLPAITVAPDPDSMRRQIQDAWDSIQADNVITIR